MEVFGGRKKKSSIWKIQLNNEDPKTIDIDLRSVTIGNFVAAKLLSFIGMAESTFCGFKTVMYTAAFYTFVYFIIFPNLKCQIISEDFVSAPSYCIRAKLYYYI
jgi:hypothetical protein